MSSDLTLGERALALAYSELGTKEVPPRSNTGPRIREFLAGCVRDPGNVKLNLTASNWCCAFASWCMQGALHLGEHPPHGYRAGVLEIIADVRDYETQWTGRWKPVSVVRSGDFAPHAGDLAIYDRSDPKDPNTSWHRHVNRVCEWRGDTFEAIGGHENDEVRLSIQRLDNVKLLGFLAYPQGKPEPRELITSQERDQILAAVALSLDGILRDSIR